MPFVANGPLDESEINRCRQEIGRDLPADYLEFMQITNGGEGFVGGEYLMLWELKDLAPFNREYEAEKYLPDVMLFGSNGGGEAYGFRTTVSGPEVVQVPFIGMAPKHCIRVAGSFSEFLAWLKST